MNMEPQTWRTTVDAFVSRNGFLLPDYDIQVFALQQIADKLDENITVSMVGEYLKVVRMIQAARAAHYSTEEMLEDEGDDLLSPQY